MAAADGRRVLVADDDEAMRVLLRTLLALAPDVELVAEARDGHEAIALVGETRPSLALLDVQMPRLDGIAAAEVIRAHYPGTAVLLHTAQMNPRARLRAEAIGVPLIDKLRLTESFDEVLAAAAGHRDASHPAEPLRTLLLLAVAARTGDAVVVVSAGREIVFYDVNAAALLGLPLPARRIPLDEMWSATQAVYDDGRPRPADERPLGMALATRRPVSDEVLWRIGDGAELHRHHVTAIPYFDDEGTFLGVGNYMTPLGRDGDAVAEQRMA